MPILFTIIGVWNSNVNLLSAPLPIYIHKSLFHLYFAIPYFPTAKYRCQRFCNYCQCNKRQANHAYSFYYLWYME